METKTLENGYIAVKTNLINNNAQYTIYNNENKRAYFILHLGNNYSIYQYKKNDQNDFCKKAPTKKIQKYLINLLTNTKD